MQGLPTLLRGIGLSLLFLAMTALAGSNATLKQIKITVATTNNTQLLLNLDKPVTYKWFFLSNPARLVLDLPQTLNQAVWSNATFSNTLVQKIRAGTQAQNGLRLVFDLNQPVAVTITALPASAQYAGRLSLNLNATKSTSVVQPSKAAYKPQAKAPAYTVSSTNNTAKPVISLSDHIAPRKLVVVIDPGHGGKDPGASGPGGLHEKDIVLSISRDLYRVLQQEPGVTVYMTRYGDYYIGLRQRLQMARRDKADIFVAIHADAYKDAYSTGASVFALSLRGASSEAARWIAEKENYSELGGVDLNGTNDMLRSVLIDLSQTATISASLWLGSDVLQQIASISPLHKSKVEQAPFMVLKSPDIPSILVETGFISNPREERALSNAAYQRKIALAIQSGINQYFRQHPPTGEVMATNQ